MKKPIFTGVCTALVTPFLDGRVNYPMMEMLLKRQIDAGIQAVVVCGTTGESPTLSDEEKLELFYRCKQYAADACTVIAGTGSNSTAHAAALSCAAQDAGVDGLLVVSPYYNKATPSGLIAHYSAVAGSVSLPVIVYNVPGRTGCNISLPVYRELAKHPNIVATKEASGNISAIAELIAELGDQLDVYSGNDDQIVPILSLGGKGVISVLSNVMPQETHDICQLYFDGKVKESAALQLKLLDLINNLFIEVNPIPVKAAMNLMGYCTKEVRSPMCEPEDAHLEILKASMKKHSLI